MPKIQDYLARCGITLTRDAAGTAPTLTIGAGDVGTWITLDNGEITGGELSNGVDNHFTCSVSSGEVEATFNSARHCLFIGSAQIRSDTNNTEFRFGLFKNSESSPITGLDNVVSLTIFDNAQSITGGKIIQVAPGDKFYVKFKVNKACTIDVNQFSVSLTEA